MYGWRVPTPISSKTFSPILRISKFTLAEPVMTTACMPPILLAACVQSLISALTFVPQSYSSPLSSRRPRPLSGSLADWHRRRKFLVCQGVKLNNEKWNHDLEWVARGLLEWWIIIPPPRLLRELMSLKVVIPYFFWRITDDRVIVVDLPLIWTWDANIIAPLVKYMWWGRQG